MISVIIPALNEEKTIANVIRFCFAAENVSEVIVVDDTSEDNTVAIATEGGARVHISKTRGKGISMKEGIQLSRNDFIVFLDADIDPYPDQTIENLTAPLLGNEADFVKGAFARNAGRVTELVAKPLLTILFPGLNSFSQPLSGMIAGKKSFFNKIEFFNDYGVDIGILIDMYLMKARVKEVNIGYIENKSKPWEALGKMSKEVSRAIISKAQAPQAGELTEADVKSLETINREMNKVLKEELSGFHKMAIFDMDKTIQQASFIHTIAAKFNFKKELDEIVKLFVQRRYISTRFQLNKSHNAVVPPRL